jgi:maltose/moltooligosaccharide transporter
MIPEAAAPTFRLFLPLMFVIQFFAWVGMFIVWLFTLPRLALLDAGPMATAAAPIRWVGYCFALYVTLAALINLGLPTLTQRFGKPRILAIALLFGAAGLEAMGAAQSRMQFLLCFVPLAIGWASLSSIPYTLVTDRVTDGRYDRAMGIFNFASVVPQVVVALSMAALVDSVSPRSAFAVGGISMGVAALLSFVLSVLYQELPPGNALPN